MVFVVLKDFALLDIDIVESLPILGQSDKLLS